MSSTKERKPCNECGSSNNFCTWMYEGKEYSKCKTPDCKNNKISYNNLGKNLPTVEPTLLTSGSYFSIPARGITKEICELYDYQVAEWRGKEAHIANYYDKEGKVCAQKIRLVKDKQFFWNGDQSKALLFGQQLQKKQQSENSFSRIFVTEGEIDCLSLAQTLPLENVVSIKTGAGDQTAGEIKQQIDYLNQFKNIIFCFDKDNVGQSTTKQLCQLFPPNKAGIVNLRHKDPNEYIKLGQTDELREDTLNWIKYTPESLVQPSIELLRTPEPEGLEVPYPQLNKLIKGIKPGRLYTLMAGSGIGKSSFTKEIVYDLVTHNKDVKVGLAYLEESQKTSAQSFIALDNNVPLHEIESNPNVITEQRFTESYNKFIGKKVWLLNASFMKLTGDELLYSINYLIEGMGCNLIVLDHVTMITYDMGGEKSERKDLDILMKNLRALVQKTQCSIILVTHLKRPQFGKSYDEGREIHMSDARSSGAIEQLSDVMIGLERNMLSDYNNKTKIKILKNRITGKTGYVDELSYIENTGRLRVL